MSEPQPATDRQLLIAELNACQMHVDNSSERTWESGGIILAGAMATLALMLQIAADDVAAAVITTAFASGAFIVLYVWQRLVVRERALAHESIARMRDIEELLGFERQARIRAADVRQRSAPWPGLPTGTTSLLTWMARTVQLGWVSVVIWRWLIVAGILD